jgi:RNA polymerase sigma-70 factor (ECF subfamily)
MQISQGDEEAFKTVFESTYPTVYKAALLVTASIHLAEEVVQDVFLKLWIKRHDLPAISNFRSYLFIMARNQAYKTLKKQLRWQDIEKDTRDEEDIHLADLEAELEAGRIMKIFEQAVDQLPAQQQTVFRLSKQQHLSREQVAHSMGLSPETVKKYLAIATLNIRAYCLKHAPDLLQGIVILSIIHSFKRS